MVQQRGQDGAVTFPFEGVPSWGIEEHAGLLVTERRREAFVGVGDLGPLHALHGIVHHGVAFAEICKQRRHGRELAANRGPFASPPVWSKNSCSLTLVVFQQPPKPFATLHWTLTRCAWAD